MAVFAPELDYSILLEPERDFWSIVADHFDPPKDAEMFRGWTPFPKQLIATQMAEIADETLFGGSAGPGKSEWMMEYGIREMERHPGNRGAIFRRVMPSLRKSIIPRLRAKLEPTGRAVWNENQKEFKFPNGSILEIGSVQFKEDVMNYNGAEYGWMGFEEVTEFMPYQYEYLLGRLRAPSTAADGIRPHVCATTNPGGLYHSYYKRRFVKPLQQDLPDLEDELTPDDDPFSDIELDPVKNNIPHPCVWRPKGIVGTHDKKNPPLTRVFIPATHIDNPMLLKKSPNYLSQLRAQSNRGLRKAMEEGDWDAIEQVEGAYWNATDLDYGRISPKAFKVYAESAYMEICVAVDPSSGKNDAFAICVMARDMVTGHLYVLDCIFLENKAVRKMAEFAINVFKKHGADVLVVETNHGAEWMMEVFREVDPYVRVKEVWASKGKMTRAQPVSHLFESDINMDEETEFMPGDDPFEHYKAHMVGNHPRLESELTEHSFNPPEGKATPLDSPDGLDAMVWAGTYFMGDNFAEISEISDDRLAGRR